MLVQHGRVLRGKRPAPYAFCERKIGEDQVGNPIFCTKVLLFFVKITDL
jgi:hypothetical protein